MQKYIAADSWYLASVGLSFCLSHIQLFLPLFQPFPLLFFKKETKSHPVWPGTHCIAQAGCWDIDLNWCITQSEVTDLFPLLSFLFPVQDVCTALLITAFNSLTWKDTLSCQRATTQLCWPLLKQVCLLPIFLCGAWRMDRR